MSFRVAIIGAQASRISRVLTIVKEDIRDEDVEFLPLVASFGMYKTESGEKVKFLSKVAYHRNDGNGEGSSVSDLVDSITEENLEGCSCPISAFAVGCGIEESDDIEQIKIFLTNVGLNIDNDMLKCITPNPEYKSMKEETEVYRQLDAESKHAATLQQTIGPGKMAKFVCKLVKDLKTEISKKPESPQEEEEEEIDSECAEHTQKEMQFDSTKILYACRVCRKILFSEEQLEDPPHIQAQHRFGWRKQGNFECKCQSLFLATGMPWMCDLSAAEGKFCCPGCNAKIGSWNWSGAQCSCGTWVTPAIQVPISKVDLVRPTIAMDRNSS